MGHDSSPWAVPSEFPVSRSVAALTLPLSFRVACPGEDEVRQLKILVDARCFSLESHIALILRPARFKRGNT